MLLLFIIPLQTPHPSAHRHSPGTCSIPVSDDLLLGPWLSSVFLWLHIALSAITRSAPIVDKRKKRDLIQSLTASCHFSCYLSIFPLKFSSRTNAKSFLYLWITCAKLTAVSCFGFEWSLEGIVWNMLECFECGEDDSTSSSIRAPSGQGTLQRGSGATVRSTKADAPWTFSNLIFIISSQISYCFPPYSDKKTRVPRA